MAATGNTGIVLNIDEQFDPLYGSPIIIPPGYTWVWHALPCNSRPSYT